MKKYTVIALSVGGLGNKIHRSGEEVTEQNFPAGNAEILVKKGFLKEVVLESEKTSDQDAKKVKVKPTEDAKPKAEAKAAENTKTETSAKA